MKNIRGFCSGVPARIALIGGLTLAACETLVAEGERTDIRGMGMARTSIVSSRGLDAVGINPANLAFPSQGTVTLSLIPLGVHAGADFINYGLYTEYFTGVQTDSGRVARYLNDQDKQKILDAFNGSNGLITLQAELRIFGLSVDAGRIGTFAFSVTEQAGGMLYIPRDYVDFLFHGNPPGSSYDFSGTDVKAAWTRSYTLSYGRTLPRLAFTQDLGVGMSLKLIHGYGYSDVQRFHTTLNTAANGVLSGTVDYVARSAGADFLSGGGNTPGYQPFPAPAGTGYAVDIGASAHINDYLSCGLSITDIGSMLWTRNVQRTAGDTSLVVDDPLKLSNRDAIEDAVKGRKEEGSGSFYSTLPTQLRMGVTLRVDQLPAVTAFPGTMLVELDYNQGFVNTPGSTRNPRFSLGVEYAPLSWLPIRTGASLGGTDHFNAAFGFGLYLGSFEFGLASENITWVFAPDSFSHVSLAMGMRLRF